MGTVSWHNGLSVKWSEGFKNGRTSVKHGEGTGRQSTSITDADTAHTVENLQKLNFELLEHPQYSLDLTPSDSPVLSTALVFLNMKYIRRAQVKVGLINLCKSLFSSNARIYYKLKSGT